MISNSNRQESPAKKQQPAQLIEDLRTEVARLKAELRSKNKVAGTYLRTIEDLREEIASLSAFRDMKELRDLYSRLLGWRKELPTHSGVLKFGIELHYSRKLAVPTLYSSSQIQVESLEPHERTKYIRILTEQDGIVNEFNSNIPRFKELLLLERSGREW